jgi:hypothetical protein
VRIVTIGNDLGAVSGKRQCFVDRTVDCLAAKPKTLGGFAVPLPPQSVSIAGPSPHHFAEYPAGRISFIINILLGALLEDPCATCDFFFS